MFQSFAYSLDDPRSATNAEYKRDFEAFLKIFSGDRTQVLGYWLDDTLFSRTWYGHLPYKPGALKADLSYYHRMGVGAVTTFGVITGRDYFLSHASPAVFLYPRLLWDVGADTRELMQDFCRNYFGSEKALETFDALEEADDMVYVEKHHLGTQALEDPGYVSAVSRAMQVARDLLSAQENAPMRARAALLVEEAATRFINPEFSKDPVN
jgi:hypothetical protein